MKIKVDIKLTADQLAEVFVHSGSDEQAKFINLIGEHFKKSEFPAELQCCYMVDDINKSGKDFIYTLANFLKVQKFSDKSKHYDGLINTYDGDGLNR